MLGMKPDDPAYTTGNIIETIHPDDRPAYREAIVAHFRGDTPRFEVDFRYRAGGRKLALVPPVRRRGAPSRRARLSHRRRDERRHRGRASATANSRPRKAEAAAAYRQDRQRRPARTTANEERYALAMESINYGLYDWNLETDDDLLRARPAHPARPSVGRSLSDAGGLEQAHPSRATGRSSAAG